MFVKMTEGEKKKYKKEFIDDRNFATINDMLKNQVVADIFRNFKSYMTFRKTCGRECCVRNYIKLGFFRNDLFSGVKDGANGLSQEGG